MVRSSLHNLRATEVSTQGKIYVARADEGVQRLSALISRMSEATRLESMLADSEKAPCDTARLAAGCVEGYRLAYSSTQFGFHASDAPIMLEVVADAVAQLRDKLVQNAVDFALPDTVVTISLFQSTKPICIRAGNKGHMLSPENSAGLFSAMASTRVDSFSNANSACHLGWSLCIVRLIAEFNHGTVAPHNLPDGSGVRFEVLLANSVAQSKQPNSG